MHADLFFEAENEFPPSRGTNQPFVLGALAIFIGAAIVRIAGAFNDLWLDEIWSLQVSRMLSSPLGVFTSLHHEINHYLNTLWLHVAGGKGDLWCRLLSLIAGIATVPVAALMGARQGRTTAIVNAVIVGFSYPLVLYSSEARGYSCEIFFALSACYFLQRFHDDHQPAAAWGAAVCQVLGLASQPDVCQLHPRNLRDLLRAEPLAEGRSRLHHHASGLLRSHHRSGRKNRRHVNQSYVLAKISASAPLSGVHWLIYRHAGSK